MAGLLDGEGHSFPSPPKVQIILRVGTVGPNLLNIQ